ncbi:hypothetical protein FACS1894179_06270 [Bacteroidia bacterium]|nr:hypothetical protein FACS1894179_06270 [Bacteroidia bacterium]
MDELKTVKSSDFEADLAIAKSYLLDNGIECAINREYLSVSTIEGGSARLQVMSGDYQRAIELLVEGGFIEREDLGYIPD